MPLLTPPFLQENDSFLKKILILIYSYYYSPRQLAARGIDVQ